MTFKNILTTTVLLVSGMTAMAAPTWMGVYGDYTRYSGGSSGTFTILVNEDYWGLQAEVGIQVDEGAWTTYAMSYSGQVDGNSVWTFTPETSFPSGSTLSFYFHAYDADGVSLWDSAGGQNYQAEIPAEDLNLVWGSELAIPVDNGSSVDVAAYDGVLYAVWQEGGYYSTGGYVEPCIKFSRKQAEHSWESPTLLVAGDGQYPKIAASATGIHVVYSSGYYPNNNQYLRSTDGGQSWALVATHQFSTRYAALTTDGDDLYIAYNEFSAPDRSEIYVRKISASASMWEAAQAVFDVTSYKATVHISNFEVRGQNLIVESELQGWYGGSPIQYFHESGDGGLSWTEACPDGRPLDTTLAENGVVYGVLSELSGDGAGLYLTQRSIGGEWSEPVLFWAGARICDGLERMGGALVAISYTYGEDRSMRISMDNGETWGEENVCGLEVTTPIYAALNDGTDIHLQTRSSTLSTGAHGYGDPVWWAGNGYHWPLNGSISSEDALWINVESWPAGSATEAYVWFSIDNGPWQALELERTGVANNNDQWHVNLGQQNSGSSITYAIQVLDSRGNELWDNNAGSNYIATVN